MERQPLGQKAKVIINTMGWWGRRDKRILTMMKCSTPNFSIKPRCSNLWIIAISDERGSMSSIFHSDNDRSENQTLYLLIQQKTLIYPRYFFLQIKCSTLSIFSSGFLLFYHVIGVSLLSFLKGYVDCLITVSPVALLGLLSIYVLKSLVCWTARTKNYPTPSYLTQWRQLRDNYPC